jgi:hypothetical protein
MRDMSAHSVVLARRVPTPLGCGAAGIRVAHVEVCLSACLGTSRIHVARYAMGGEKRERVDYVVFVSPPPPAPPGCGDEATECPQWAESGECERNPLFMVNQRHERQLDRCARSVQCAM